MTKAVNDNEPVAEGGRRCPVCGQPTQEKWRPFCSKRCADIDLHRWLSGSYAIPSEEEDGDEEGNDGR